MEVVVIVAGGAGTRMRSETPKQFLEVAGKPILLHTVEAFHSYSKDINIVLVLPKNQIDTWNSLVGEASFPIPHSVVEGGLSRTESVRNGLALVDNEDMVAIHDGVRPLIGKETIAEGFQLARRKGSAVAAIPLKESLRRMDDSGISETVDRSKFFLVQTPQVFKGILIKEAYKKIENTDLEFTDDASVAEFAGHQIHLFDGEYSNIKITIPDDLLIAEKFLLKKWNR